MKLSEPIYPSIFLIIPVFPFTQSYYLLPVLIKALFLPSPCFAIESKDKRIKRNGWYLFIFPGEQLN